MSEYFYDGQIKRYLTQFMRLMSNFSYKDAKGKLVQIPVRYGDMNRQVAQVLNKNSENIIQSAPFIACYIKGMEFARDRLQDPTFVSKVNIRERAYATNPVTGEVEEYLNTQGANYTVERLMPTPFNITFAADIWTTNTDQKLQVLEQLLILFNPSMEIQTGNNYIDWTSLSLLELTSMTFSSRQIPQGAEQDIDIANLQFLSPVWITPPAKIKKLGVITKIINSIYTEPTGQIGEYSGVGLEFDLFSGRSSVSVSALTFGNYDLLVLDNTAKLIPPGNSVEGELEDAPTAIGSGASWAKVLDLYPGKFTAGLSQVRLTKPSGSEIVGYLSLDPIDPQIMRVNWDEETKPADTLIDPNVRFEGQLGFTSTGAVSFRVDAIIDPQKTRPTKTIDITYLLIEDIRGGFVKNTITVPEQTRRIDTDFPFYKVDSHKIWVDGVEVSATAVKSPIDQYDETVGDYILVLTTATSTTSVVTYELYQTTDGPDAWKNANDSDFIAKANDIVRWNGSNWVILFESETATDLIYITNSRTNIQYAWDGTQWLKSYEGIYPAKDWRIVL